MITVMSNLASRRSSRSPRASGRSGTSSTRPCPDYVIRMAGETYKPEWYANVNPLVVVLLVVGITQLVRVEARGEHPRRDDAHSALVARDVAHHALPRQRRDGRRLRAPDHAHDDGRRHRDQGTRGVLPEPKVPQFAVREQAPAGLRGLYLGYAHMNTFLRVAVRVRVRGRLHAEGVLPPTLRRCLPTCRRSTPRRSRAPVRCRRAYAHAHHSGTRSRASAVVADRHARVHRGDEPQARALKRRNSCAGAV